MPPSEPSGCPRLTEAEARSERCRSVFPAPLLTNQKLSMVYYFCPEKGAILSSGI